jgi:Flp pilus assembly protein TadG
MKALPTRRPKLSRDKRGLVMVEFAIASMPLLMTFLGATEVGRTFEANMVLKHSASVAARAAAVIANSTGTINPGPNQSGDPKAQIEQAAIVALGRWSQQDAHSQVKVTVNDQSNESDPFGMVCTTVSSNYRCRIPLGGRLLCGMDGIMQKSATSCHPHQGAKYKL